MKKIISTFLLLSMFALAPVIPASASPVTFEPGAADFTDVFGPFETGEFAAPCPRGTVRRRQHTRTKRKLRNALITGAIGTAIGAGVNGKSGALIGAGTGAGGYLVYRYVKDRRGRCVLRRA